MGNAAPRLRSPRRRVLLRSDDRDGIAGRLSAECGVVLAVEDRRGYVFRLYGDITVNIDLREVIRSIELDPETL